MEEFQERKTDVLLESGKAEKRTVVDRHGETHEDVVYEGFSLSEKIKDLHGPFIEVAGPTERGYDIVDIGILEAKKVYVSNLFPGMPIYSQETGDFEGYVGSVDFQADARHLPFGDNSISALFISCLPRGGIIKLPGNTASVDYDAKENQREIAIKEAWRTLENEGLLIWQGGLEKDIKFAQSLGFKLRKTIQYRSNYDVIFEKG